MPNQTTYSIKYVSLQTGLKPYIIRSWESRYRAVCPQRADNQRRCFTDADIRRLRLLKRAVDQGHTISGVSKLSNGELRTLLQVPDPSLESDDPKTDGDTSTTIAADNAADVVSSALRHIRHLDVTALERLLNAAAVDMTRQTFLQQVMVPLFNTVGEEWRAGKMKIIGEHMASLVIRSILWDLLRGVEPSATAPRIVVATPIGHMHEVGALAVALTASECGWQALYFGPDLPSEEIAYAAKSRHARAVALSLCHRLSGDLLVPELKKLRRLLDESVPILIGGPGSGILQRMKLPLTAVVMNDLHALRAYLERVAATTAGDSKAG